MKNMLSADISSSVTENCFFAFLNFKMIKIFNMFIQASHNFP